MKYDNQTDNYQNSPFFGLSSDMTRLDERIHNIQDDIKRIDRTLEEHDDRIQKVEDTSKDNKMFLERVRSSIKNGLMNFLLPVIIAIISWLLQKF